MPKNCCLFICSIHLFKHHTSNSECARSRSATGVHRLPPPYTQYLKVTGFTRTSQVVLVAAGGPDPGRRRACSRLTSLFLSNLPFPFPLFFPFLLFLPSRPLLQNLKFCVCGHPSGFAAIWRCLGCLVIEMDQGHHVPYLFGMFAVSTYC